MRQNKATAVKSPEASEQLFADACQWVTDNDIEAFCPNDPGYYAYVATFKAIRAKGLRKPFEWPAKGNFEISETVCLTNYATGKHGVKEINFLRFRIFTNSVAVVLAVHDEHLFDANAGHVAAHLLSDALALGDKSLLNLLPRVIREFDRSYKNSWIEGAEQPFLTLASLLLISLGHDELSKTPRLARRLLLQDRRFNKEAAAQAAHPRFLWGCGGLNFFHQMWKDLVRKHFFPHSDDPTLQLLRTELLAGDEAAA